MTQTCDGGAVEGAVADPCALLEAAVAAFDRQAEAHVNGAVAREDLPRMRRAMDRLEAHFSRRVGRFDAEREYAVDRVCTTVSWLRTHCRMSAADAVQRVEVGRRLPEIEGAEKAFQDGEICFRNATILARAVCELGSERIAPAASTLLDLAKTLPPHRLRVCTVHARHCADPDGALAEGERQHHNRWLNLSQTFGGVWSIDGVLDAEAGKTLHTALEPLCKPTPNDERNAGQRRADALVELATRQLQAGELPTSHGQRPHLVVTVPVATLRGEAGAGAMNGGWPVHAETVQRLACDAAVTEIQVDAVSGEPLSVDRTRRTVPPGMRRALEVRDRGCRFPGCDRPVEWTDAHHVRTWTRDEGKTEVPNLVLLCRRCHRRVHEGRWRLNVEGGSVTCLPP